MILEYQDFPFCRLAEKDGEFLLNPTRALEGAGRALLWDNGDWELYQGFVQGLGVSDVQARWSIWSCTALFWSRGWSRLGRRQSKNPRSLWPWGCLPGLLSACCCCNKDWKGRRVLVDVDLIFQIAAIGIIVAVLNQLLMRSGREEQAMMTTLAGLIVVLMMIIREIDALFQAVKSIFSL